MSNTFFISDTHFGHARTCQDTENGPRFRHPDGTPLRPFESVSEMDETMIDNWNKTVKPGDKVYHLGDVVIAKRNLELIKRLNGKKRLVRGNHDIFPTKLYMEVGFEEIYGVRVFDDFICSHIPLARDSITERFKTNVHGHLHGNVVHDPAYVSVCVEQIGYTPMSIDVLRLRIRYNQNMFNDFGIVPNYALLQG